MMPEIFRIEWRPSVVLISFGISFLGSSCGLNLSEQYRLISTENKPKLYNKPMLGFIWALSIGGVGIWTMDIIGLSAISLIDPYGNEVSVRFRLDFLVVSLIAVILFCRIGIIVATRDEVYAMNKVETLEVFIRDSNNMTIGEMKNTKNRNSVIFRTLFKGISNLVIGSLGFGAALIIGSYVTITSLIIDECTIVWNIGPLIGMIFVIFLVCAIECWILFRMLALYPYNEALRAFGIFACASGICGIHYAFIGAAVTFLYIPGKTFSSPYPTFKSYGDYEVYGGVIVGSLLYSCLVLLVALADTRFWFYRLSKASRLIDDMIVSMDKRIGVIAPDCNSDQKINLIEEYNNFMIDYKTGLGRGEKLGDIKKENSLKIRANLNRNKSFAKRDVIGVGSLKTRSFSKRASSLFSGGKRSPLFRAVSSLSMKIS